MLDAMFACTGYLILLYFASATVVSIWRSPRYPTTIPWAGHGKTWSASIKNYLQGLTKSDQWLSEAYDRYSKNNTPFVLPATIGGHKEVVLPRSQMAALLEQPDDVLSASVAHYELLHGNVSFIDPYLLEYPYHEKVIHKPMVRNLTSLLSDLEEEIVHDMDEVYGTSHTWKKINLWDSLFQIIPVVTNRITVGYPLNRNKDLLSNVVAFTNDVIRNLMLFALLPTFIHPVFGWFLMWPARYHYWKASKHSLPLIKRRLEDIRRSDAGELKDWKEPNDFISWTIRQSQQDGRLDEMEPEMIAKRLLPVNFASIHTTSMSGHSSLLDILASDESVLDALRSEAIEAYNGGWTKSGLAKMVKMDSAIRESLRIHGFSQTGLQRYVLNGVTIAGQYYGPGVLLSCPTKPVNLDKELYPNAKTYDPFRFTDEESKAALVLTSDKFFAFGHGRHACPGRFFITQELKMMFAYLLCNYDVKRVPARPDMKFIGRNIVHDQTICIEIRRRTKKVIM